MKYRNALGVLFAAALMVFSLAEVISSEGEWYGVQAIGVEASGFDALAFVVFGGGPITRSDARLAAMRGVAVK